MNGTVTLSDGGQSYIEFDIINNIIHEVRPARLAGWKGSKILNAKYKIGGKIVFDLQWRPFNPTLKYPIIAISYKDIEDSEWLKANMSDDKKLYADPRGGEDRLLYEVDCNGLPLYFEELNPAAIAAADALLNIDKIPEVLLEDVMGVMLYDSIKPGSPETIADIGDFFMAIYNDHIVDYGIITHEATHAWAHDKWGSATPPSDTAYVEAIRFSGEEPITEYAKTNDAEDLAEGVRFYVVDPTRMKEKCPLRFDIIDRMMADPDYYG